MRHQCSALLVALGTCAQATVIRVPADQPTIQAGLDAAGEGDTVLVAPGTYTGAGNQNIEFRGVDRVLLSESGAAATVIDCQGAGSALDFSGAETPASLVSGFTITGATFSGVDCVYSSPTLIDCVISGNSGGSGGGLSCRSSHPTLIDCSISENSGEGGAARCKSSGPVFINCSLSSNNGELGGALYLYDTSAPILTNCIISGNSATGDGGAIFCSESNPRLSNCVVVDNSSGGLGGGLYFGYYSGGELTNCVIWGNSPDQIHNVPSDHWNPTLRYCDVEGGYEGTGNIDADPLFRSFGGFDYLLAPSSPCVDSGDPAIEDGVSDWHSRWPLWYPNAPRSDMGAYGGPGNAGWLR